MTKELDDIWARIEEQRANYASIIEKADETIRAAQALKRDAREGMDALPVAKTRRARKGDDVSAEAASIDEIVGGKS